MNNNSGENTYYGSTNQPQPEDEKFTPKVIKDIFTEEELERYNQLRRQGYVSEQPSTIEVGGFKIYVNKINLMALEDLMVECCEEYLYPTKLTWVDLYKVKNKLKEGIPAFQFLNLNHLLYADLSFLEHLLNNQKYSEMQIMKLLSEARKLRGLEPVALDGAPETDHTENKPVVQQATLSEKQYTVLYEALKSEIRREVENELAKEKILQEQIPIQNTKLVFLVMVERFNNEEEGYIWPGGKCSPEFLNLLRTQTQEDWFYIQITPEVIAKIDLDYWFGEVYDRKRYVALYCVFKLDGTMTNDIAGSRSTNEESYVPVKVEFFCDESVTFYCAGLQLEVGAYPTSFIVANGTNQSRAKDELVYEKSPFQGLTEFTFFMHIDRWAGDGTIFDAGNIKAHIRASKLVVELISPDQVNTEVISQEYVLGQNTDIAFRLKNARQAKLYVDGELRAAKQLPFNFVGRNSNLTIGGENVLSFNNFYVFNVALEDDEPGLFGFAGGNLAAIFSKRYGLPVNENTGTIVFPAVTIPPDGRAYVNFPRSKYASQKIIGKASETVTTKQSVAFDCIATTTGTASITLNVGTGDVTFTYIVPTGATRQQIVQALGDQIAANSAITAVVNVSYTVSGANLAPGEFDPNAFSNAFSRPTSNPVQVPTESILITKKHASGPAFTYSHSGHFNARIMTPHQSETDYLVLASPFDFRPGQAYILDNYSTICEVIISHIEVVSGQGRVYCRTEPSTFLSLVVPNKHTLFQANWTTEIAPVNYVVDHLESYREISVYAKAMDGFVFKNDSTEVLTITPHVSVLF